MDHIGIFARYPVAGEVKQRLSPALPASLAVELYAAMLGDALEVAGESGSASRSLYWASEPRVPESFPIPVGVTVRRQRGTDLGERLSEAFADLVSNPGDRAVVIGSDCPDLTPDILRGAFAALGRHDVVLGPALDGGYCLIGLARPAPALFTRVDWGTDVVLAQTLERAREAGLTVAMLDALGDIDTPEDLVRFIARRSFSPHGPDARTEAALIAMGLLPPRG